MACKKRKSRATWLTIDLPSNGLNYDAFGDREVEQHIEYRAGDDGDYKYDPTDMQFEKNHHHWLQLDAATLSGILNDCTEWSKVLAKAHEYHTEAFDGVASDDLGFPLDLEHDSGDTARIKLSVAKKLLRLCKHDKYEGFIEIAKEEDGRYYPRYDPTELLASPLPTWESEPLGWLLRAALAVGTEKPMQLSTLERHTRIACGMPVTTYMAAQTERAFDEAVFQAIYGGEGEYTAWSDAVDWDTYDRKVQEARHDLFDALNDEDRQWLIDHGHWDGVLSWNARCPLTPDMFQPSQTL